MIAEQNYSFSCSVESDGVSKSALSENFHIYQFVYIDELVYYEVDGTGYYPLQGVNHNIEAVADEAGDIVEWYEIGAFGDVKILAADGSDITSTGSTVGNNHFFQGRDYDADVGLYYFRNRWMSPTMGRFISRDPIRYKAGDINLYRFVGNNPFGLTDPMGLFTLDALNSLSWIDLAFVNHYFHGFGADVSLSDFGLLDIYKNSNSFQKKWEEIKSSLECNTKGVVTIKTHVTKEIFSIGDTQYDYEYNCNGSQCEVIFHFDDRFEDPFDLWEDVFDKEIGQPGDKAFNPHYLGVGTLLLTGNPLLGVAGEVVGGTIGGAYGIKEDFKMYHKPKKCCSN